MARCTANWSDRCRGHRYSTCSAMWIFAECWRDCCNAASTVNRILSYYKQGMLAVFQSAPLIIHYAQWGTGSKRMNKTLWKIQFHQVFTCVFSSLQRRCAIGIKFWFTTKTKQKNPTIIVDGWILNSSRKVWKLDSVNYFSPLMKPLGVFISLESLICHLYNSLCGISNTVKHVSRHPRNVRKSPAVFSYASDLGGEYWGVLPACLTVLLMP